MSRSNPTANAQNPATRWFEWNGETGTIRYYDKDAKANRDVNLPFTFLLLDQLGGVGGWHEASKSSIYSNAVRDTRQDVLIVKAFKGGTLAEGIYQNIKAHVTSKAVGGYFITTCYVAVKDKDNGLSIAGLKFKGSALGAWMEFQKAHRQELYEQAITITGFHEGQKGRIVFRVPTFALKPVSGETQAAAVGLDRQLQAYLESYLSRTKTEQVEQPHVPVEPSSEPPPPPDDDPYGTGEDDRFHADDDDIPF